MDRTSLARAIRQPKAAAVAGLVFGLILTTVLLLLQSVAPQTTSELGSWAEDQSRRDSVVVALALIPFAGIAFLWFIAVVRSELGRLGDRFFETVFLGSGLLFVAMLFAAAAVLSGLLSLVDAGFPLAPGAEAECLGARLRAAGAVRHSHGRGLRPHRVDRRPTAPELSRARWPSSATSAGSSCSSPRRSLVGRCSSSRSG